MADTDWTAFPNQSTLNDTDTILARTAAGGGVEIAGTALARSDASGVFNLISPYGIYRQVRMKNNVPAGVNADELYAGGITDTFGSFVFDNSYYSNGGLFNPTAAVAAGMRMIGGVVSICCDTGLTAGTAYAPTVVVSFSKTSVQPGADNSIPLGSAAKRWSVVYAGTASINTSDEREKQQIEAIPDTWLDAWADVEWSRFKFNDSVAVKGADGARLHTGLVAQQVQAAFAAQGLDAAAIGLIGLLCYDEWDAVPATPEQRDEEGNVIVAASPGSPAGDRYGLRYEECFAVEAAYQRRRMATTDTLLAAIEARLTAIEARLTALETPPSG